MMLFLFAILLIAQAVTADPLPWPSVQNAFTGSVQYPMQQPEPEWNWLSNLPKGWRLTQHAVRLSGISCGDVVGPLDSLQWITQIQLKTTRGAVQILNYSLAVASICQQQQQFYDSYTLAPCDYSILSGTDVAVGWRWLLVDSSPAPTTAAATPTSLTTSPTTNPTTATTTSRTSSSPATGTTPMIETTTPTTTATTATATTVVPNASLMQLVVGGLSNSVGISLNLTASLTLTSAVTLITVSNQSYLVPTNGQDSFVFSFATAFHFGSCDPKWWVQLSFSGELSALSSALWISDAVDVCPDRASHLLAGYRNWAAAPAVAATGYQFQWLLDGGQHIYVWLQGLSPGTASRTHLLRDSQLQFTFTEQEASDTEPSICQSCSDNGRAGDDTPDGTFKFEYILAGIAITLGAILLSVGFLWALRRYRRAKALSSYEQIR